MNFKKRKKEYTATNKMHKREKDGDLQTRFMKATTFTGIPLPHNQSYLVLVCLNSQSNFPNAE